MSEWHAHVVQYNPVSMSIELIVGIRGGQDQIRYLTGLSSGAAQMEYLSDLEEAPKLRIPEEMARPLMDALIQHYGGATTSQQLRYDYDAERKRVDKLIDAVIKGVVGE